MLCPMGLDESIMTWRQHDTIILDSFNALKTPCVSVHPSLPLNPWPSPCHVLTLLILKTQGGGNSIIPCTEEESQAQSVFPSHTAHWDEDADAGLWQQRTRGELLGWERPHRGTASAGEQR